MTLRTDIRVLRALAALTDELSNRIAEGDTT